MDDCTRIYFRLGHDLLRAGEFGSIADFADALKHRCAAEKLPYNAWRLSCVIEQLMLRADPWRQHIRSPQ